jgi:hypothetical protein
MFGQARLSRVVLLSQTHLLNLRVVFEDCSTSPLLEYHERTIVDSGCTRHFLLINALCRGKKRITESFESRIVQRRNHGLNTHVIFVRT